MNDDLKIIKKKYGEKMMYLCRSLFSTILERPGVLSELMLSNFEPSRFLYDDIVKSHKEDDFKNFIYSFIDVEKKEAFVDKTPEELLSDADYDLFKCETEEDIQSFKKYYAKGEELCTFRGGRLNYCHVFFAVKKNVDEIKRENFNNPQRQDEYGTSVISIQFTKGDTNTLSIKNRYNHRVNNPDSTFSNNLDNIIEGLTDSFEKHYNLNLTNEKQNFELPGYVRANDGKFYKYNYEINNIYYCSNNVIIDNFMVVDAYMEKEKYLVLDYFILDLVNKEIKLYDNSISDAFVDGFINIDKISIKKSADTDNKIIEIKCLDGNLINIEIDNTNKILKYYNNLLATVKDRFLFSNQNLIDLKLPNLTQVGMDFLCYNKNLTNLDLSNLTVVGSNFLFDNENLENLNVPKLAEVGTHFLQGNRSLINLNLPELVKAGYGFLFNNKKLENLNVPKLAEVGDKFLDGNYDLVSLDLLELVLVGDDFLHDNKNLESLNSPKLNQVGHNFLCSNRNLVNLNLPELVVVGDCFLQDNENLESLNSPKLNRVGHNFLCSNQNLINLNLPELVVVGHNFLCSNQNLINLDLPNLPDVEAELLPDSSKNKEDVVENNKEYCSNIKSVEKSDKVLKEKITEKLKNIKYKVKKYISSVQDKITGGIRR